MKITNYEEASDIEVALTTEPPLTREIFDEALRMGRETAQEHGFNFKNGRLLVLADAVGEVSIGDIENLLTLAENKVKGAQGSDAAKRKAMLDAFGERTGLPRVK